jgi:hypothetical protein
MDELRLFRSALYPRPRLPLPERKGAPRTYVRTPAVTCKEEAGGVASAVHTARAPVDLHPTVQENKPRPLGQGL